MAEDTKLDLNWALLFACWLMVTIATLGSLFFSEVMELAPCSLCWYQRIFMYPLVLMFLVGLFPLDVNVVRYSLPLVVAGWLVALYHTLLYWGIVPEEAVPCGPGVSCKEQYIELFGFLSIPLMSLLGFTVVAAMLLILRRRLTR